MGYAKIQPGYYSAKFPQSFTRAGSIGWSHAPVPMWGANPMQEGPQLMGLGAAPEPAFTAADKATYDRIVKVLQTGKSPTTGATLTPATLILNAAPAYRLLQRASGRAPTKEDELRMHKFAFDWMTKESPSKGVWGAWQALLAYRDRIYDVNQSMKKNIEATVAGTQASLQKEAFDKGLLKELPPPPVPQLVAEKESGSKLGMYVAIGTALVVAGVGVAFAMKPRGMAANARLVEDIPREMMKKRDKSAKAWANAFLATGDKSMARDADRALQAYDDALEAWNVGDKTLADSKIRKAYELERKWKGIVFP